MNESRHGSEETIFSTALQLSSAAERAGFLDTACGGDVDLRQRIEALLAAQSGLGDFMEDSSVFGTGSSQETTQAAISAEEGPGTCIGRYKLLQKIGEGGCGVVYMAEQEQPVRRRVALKVIKLGMDTKSVIARFEAERQALAMMDHPNIAKVLDAGATETGRPYFVMELVRGIKITEFCDQNRLSTRERLDLFVQVCQAIQHAHQKGIIHRDIKPSNVLVTIHDPGAPGVPKVIDFGIAKATQGRLTDQTLFTAFEQFLGTPAYMSPEQTLLTAHDIDTRSDIYSLGVLLYELLTGHTPFATKELLAVGFEEMRRTIREKEPQRPSTRLSTLLAAEQATAARYRHTEPPKLIHLVRGDLDWIVMKCLEKDRSRRYETANAVATDLQRHLANEPIVARPPSRLYEFQKSVRRHKVGFAATAAVMIALAAGVLLSAWEASRAQRNAQLAQYRAYVSDMRVARDALGEGDIGRARRLLRRYIPAPGDKTDLRQWEWRELAYECRPDEHFSLGPHPGFITNVKFVNQDTLLATVQWDDRTFFWNWKEQRLANVLTNAQERGVGPAAFSPARHGMFWHDQQEDLPLYVRFLDFQTGLETNVSFLGKVVGPVAVSPDGRLLAVSRQEDGQGRIEVWDLERQTNVVRLPMGLQAYFQLRFSRDGTRLAATDVAGRLSLWNVGQWSLLARTNADLPSWDLASLEFSPNSKWIVTGGKDWKVKIWDAHSGSFLRELANPGRSVVFAFSPDSTNLAGGGVDRDIRLWDTSTWEVKRVLRGHTDQVARLDFSPDGRWLASGSLDGEVKVFKVSSLADSAPTLDRVRRFGQLSIDTAAAPDGLGFVRNLGPLKTAFEVCHAPRFEPVTLQPTSVPDAPSVCKILLAGSTQGVVGYSDGMIGLYNISEGLPLVASRDERGKIVALAASRDGKTLVSCATPGFRTSVSIWQLPDLKRITNKVVEAVLYYGCAISDDARHLALYSSGGEIEVWDVPSLQRHPAWKVAGRARNLTAATFSPDGKLLATACSDGSAYIWDFVHRRAVATLPTIRPQISSLVFSADSTRLAAGALDEVKLFDVNTGEEMAALSDPDLHDVQAVFGPKARDLIVIGRDGVRVWHAPPLEEVRSDWLSPEASRNASNLQRLEPVTVKSTNNLRDGY